MNILDEIANKTKERIAKEKEIESLDLIKDKCKSIYLHENDMFSFEKALQKDAFSIIAECKKASPSMGIICHNYDYLNIAKDYEKANATCISVLTEPYYFKGSYKHLYDIAHTISIPVLQKDFFIDEYMIYKAYKNGANAILLIVSLLDKNTLLKYLSLCNKLGLSALVETHNANEINIAIQCGARLIGVNNRDLTSFLVNTNTALNLKHMVPDNITFVSESGIKDRSDIEKLIDNGIKVALIGSAIMTAKDKCKKIKELKGEL